MYSGSEQLAELHHWQNDRGPKARTDGLNDKETLSAAEIAESKRHYDPAFWADDSKTVVHPGPLSATAGYLEPPRDKSTASEDFPEGRVIELTEDEILKRIRR